MRTARRSIGQLSGQQLKSTASPVDNDHFIDAGMMPADVLVEVAIAVFAGMFGAVLLRWVIPQRFTVRRLLLVTAAVAVFIAAYKALAPH